MRLVLACAMRAKRPWSSMLCGLLVACGQPPADRGASSEAASNAAVARDVQRTVEDLMAKPPEAIPAAVTAQAVDPAKLLGTWSILHIIYKEDGAAKPPTPPIMPGTWSFTKDGGFHKGGGNELDGTYVLTAGTLVISALGPALDYRVDSLTATELVVTVSNPIGKKLFETTTVPRRIEGER